MDSDGSDNAQEPVTPVKSRKPRAKWVSWFYNGFCLTLIIINRRQVKSQETIEDSDINEDDDKWVKSFDDRKKDPHQNSSDYKNSVSQKAKSKTATDKKAKDVTVKVLNKKIVVSGSKFPSAPVEDADNNVFLDGGSPLQRSPKKKWVVL